MRPVLQIILLSLFIFAALSYGAVHSWAYSIVFGVTFLLCAIVFLQSGVSLWRRSRRIELPLLSSPFRGPFLVFLAAFMVIVLLQLVPLPAAVLKVLSPYTAYLYGQVHGLTAPGGVDSGNLFWGYLSLDRDKTVKSLLALAAYLGFGFLVTRAVQRSRDVTRLAVVLIAFSVGLSLYGLFNLSGVVPQTAGPKNPLTAGARVSATLVNPDHFGSYLIIAIYLTFGFLAAFLRKAPQTMGRSLFQRGMSILNAEGAYVPKAFLLLFLVAVMTFVLFYTLSRGAVIGFSASMVFCFVLLFLKTRRSVFLLLMIPPIVFVAYYIRIVGADPLVQRLEETSKELLGLDENARVHFYRAGLELWRKFPLFGSGLGSFEVISRLMLSKDYQGTYIPYIHNDWLQLAIETGWIGGVLFVLAMGSLFVWIMRRWWRAEERWGFGFGLAAMSAMLGMGIHAFLDFGLRIPVNAIFLVLLVALALAALDEGFGRKMQADRTRSLPGIKRSTIGWVMLMSAAVFGWSSMQVVRYGLAQYYCPSEIDTVHRRVYEISTSKLQKALRLNPLNGEYWLSLAMVAAVPDSGDSHDETSSASDGPAINDHSRAAATKHENPPEPPFSKGGQGGFDINPKIIPGWEGARMARESLEDRAFAEALACSPAESVFWLAWADHLWEKLQREDQREEGRTESKLLEQTAQCYTMAVDLNPTSPAARRRATEYFQWQKQKDLPEP